MHVLLLTVNVLQHCSVINFESPIHFRNIERLDIVLRYNYMAEIVEMLQSGWTLNRINVECLDTIVEIILKCWVFGTFDVNLATFP